MIYRILKLHFTGNVHFGEGMLESTASTFCADTLFSALCHDAPDEIPQLVCTVREGRLAFSDAFPYDECEKSSSRRWGPSRPIYSRRIWRAA